MVLQNPAGVVEYSGWHRSKTAAKDCSEKFKRRGFPFALSCWHAFEGRFRPCAAAL
jgi:hypothetical protein